MTTNIYFVFCLAHLFLELDMLQRKDVEKIEIHILYPITCFRKSYRLWDNEEKYCTAGQATDNKMAHTNYMLDTKH